MREGYIKMQEYSIEYAQAHPAKWWRARTYVTIEAPSDDDVIAASDTLFSDWSVVSITTTGDNKMKRVVWSTYE
jgi:hypothetical protein